MPELSTNPKTIASRERAKLWSDAENELYKKEFNDRTAICKRLTKLKESLEYKAAILALQTQLF